MRRRSLRLLTALLFLAVLALMLRHDLGQLAWRQGRERLSSGDHRAALALLSRAGNCSPDSLPIAFATGVAHYRLGEFRQARSRFQAASAAADPALRSAALYNLGNCAFRMGDKAPAGDRQAAAALFREAEREYRRALALDPGAADARHNLALAGTRLSALAGASPGEAPSGVERSGDEGRGPSAASDGEKGGEGRARRAGEAGAGQRTERGEELGKEGAPRPASADRSAAPARPGAGRPTLTRDQAERLLSEARGREALPSAPPGQLTVGRQARPDRDW